MIAAAPHLRLVGEGKSCDCDGVTGPAECGRCGGRHVILTGRDHMLLETVVEAARALMVAQLRLERAQGVRVETEHELLAADAWQTLRDSLWSERRARGGR